MEMLVWSLYSLPQFTSPISKTKGKHYALVRQIGEFQGRPTSVVIDDVDNDLRQASNTQGRSSVGPGKRTFGWTQFVLTTGLAVVLSLCAMACSSGKSPEQTQTPATPDKAAAQPEALAKPTELTETGGVDLPPIVKTPWKAAAGAH